MNLRKIVLAATLIALLFLFIALNFLKQFNMTSLSSSNFKLVFGLPLALLLSTIFSSLVWLDKDIEICIGKNRLKGGAAGLLAWIFIFLVVILAIRVLS